MAFAAFRTYAEMGSARRLVDVSRQLSKSMQLLARWSRRWNWQARCAPSDSDQWLREDEDKRKQRDEALEGRVRLGMAMRGLVARAVVGDPGSDVPGFDPRRLTGGELARVAEVADKLVALGLNLPTDFSQLQVAMKAQVQHQLPGEHEFPTDAFSLNAASVAASLLIPLHHLDGQARRTPVSELRQMADQLEQDQVIDAIERPALPPAQPTYDQEPVSSLPQEQVLVAPEEPYVAPEPVPPTPPPAEEGDEEVLAPDDWRALAPGDPAARTRPRCSPG